jgi:hypothetical protein
VRPYLQNNQSKKDWRYGSSAKLCICIASAKLCFQIPVLPKKRKKESKRKALFT